MRTRAKFVQEVTRNFTLDGIRRIDVQFNPFHPNAGNVREFFHSLSQKKITRSNPECVTKAKVVSDSSDPKVTVLFNDDHKLHIDGKYLESGHFIKLIRHFRILHKHAVESY